MLITVVRFPNGHWSTGGRPDSPDYELCEIWRIEAPDEKTAIKRAQGRRARARAKRASSPSSE